MRTAQELREAVHAYRLSRVVLTAMDLDLFTQLEDGPLPVRELAARVGADERALDRLCAVLCNEGLLERDGGGYANSPLAREELVSGTSGVGGGLAHASQLWPLWARLTDAVREGGASWTREIADRGEDWLASFIGAMHARGMSQAAADVNLLDLYNTGSVLDVGGGSAVYSMAFARVKQDMGITVMDLPEVIGLTRRYVEDAGLSQRIVLRAGDFHRDDLGGPYDLVFLSAIVHGNTIAENMALLRRCAASLHPGGQLVVQDFVMDEDRQRPPAAAMFALNMLVATPGGDTYTESEIRNWMLEAGLGDIRRQDTRTGSTQVIGRAPSP